MVERLAEDNVIDNREIKLKDALNDILPQIKTVDIAVGYFYLSGLSQVIDTLEKADKIRLLLSPTLDNHTFESIFDIYQDSEKATEKLRDMIEEKTKKEREKEVVEDAEKKARRQLEISKQTSADEKIIKRMKKLIEDGKLEVKVYLGERLHAKAYILVARKRHEKSYGIVGSSNFTYSGFVANSELNLQTNEAHDINKLTIWFENLWKDGKDFQNNYQELFDACWVSDNYTQHDVFLKALYHEHKEKLETPDDASTIWKKALPPLIPFQDDSIEQGLVMFE